MNAWVTDPKTLRNFSFVKQVNCNILNEDHWQNRWYQLESAHCAAHLARLQVRVPQYWKKTCTSTWIKKGVAVILAIRKSIRKGHNWTAFFLKVLGLVLGLLCRSQWFLVCKRARRLRRQTGCDALQLKGWMPGWRIQRHFEIFRLWSRWIVTF